MGTRRCMPSGGKIGNLLKDIPSDHLALQLVAVKVLTNLSLDPGVNWSPSDIDKICDALETNLEPQKCEEGLDADDERQELEDLSRKLTERLQANKQEN